MRRQHAHVLDCGDQIILDLLAAKSSPTSPLEVMVVGAIGKTRFHQVLAPFAITARTEAVSRL